MLRAAAACWRCASDDLAFIDLVATEAHLSREVWDDLVAELAAGYAPLLPRGRWVDGADREELLRLVAEQTGPDRAGAHRALDATLGDELLDVKAQLPEDYVRALALAP